MAGLRPADLPVWYHAGASSVALLYSSNSVASAAALSELQISAHDCLLDIPSDVPPTPQTQPFKTQLLISAPPSLAPNLLLCEWHHRLPDHLSPKLGGRTFLLPAVIAYFLGQQGPVISKTWTFCESIPSQIQPSGHFHDYSTVILQLVFLPLVLVSSNPFFSR